MGDDKRQNAFCTATHETLKQANPLLVNGLPEKQERKWAKKKRPQKGDAQSPQYKSARGFACSNAERMGCGRLALPFTARR